MKYGRERVIEKKWGRIMEKQTCLTVNELVVMCGGIIDAYGKGENRKIEKKNNGEERTKVLGVGFTFFFKKQDKTI